MRINFKLIVTNINTCVNVLLLIYAAGVACGAGDAHSFGAPDVTPSLLGACDDRMAFGLIPYLCYTYFVIVSIDSGLWNVTVSDCRQQ